MTHICQEFRFCSVGSFCIVLVLYGFFGFYPLGNINKDSHDVYNLSVLQDRFSKFFYPYCFAVFMDDFENKMELGFVFNQFFCLCFYNSFVFGMYQVNKINSSLQKIFFAISGKVFNFIIKIYFGPFAIVFGKMHRSRNIISQQLEAFFAFFDNSFAIASLNSIGDVIGQGLKNGNFVCTPISFYFFI